MVGELRIKAQIRETAGAGLLTIANGIAKLKGKRDENSDSRGDRSDRPVAGSSPESESA
jgi:hypothetical protein